MTVRLVLPDLEKYITTIDVAGYAGRRNYLSGSTGLSEYISRGYISLPKIKSLLLLHNTSQAAQRLLSELAWREYWQHTWRVRNDEIFDYFRPLSYEPRHGIPTAVLQAKTGIDALDSGIRQLYETGYIHNHLRLWIAGLVCNVAKCDWRVGAEWMHSYLIDGDYASNHLSWQWVAGSYTGSAYLPQQDNINTYTQSMQKNTYLDTSYEHIAAMPVPDILSDITTHLPSHTAARLPSTITVDEINSARTLLLYSPWTLDPLWRLDESAERVLVMPSELFADDSFSNNVLESINYFGGLITGLKTIYLSPAELRALQSATIYRKDYPGIRNWPGNVDPPELLYPDIEKKFYPSFSSYFKQIPKSQV